MEYYLLKPINYDPKKSYPLVLTLHGASGHSYAAAVLAISTMQQSYEAFVLVPHGRYPAWAVSYFENDTYPNPSTHIIKIIDSLEDEYSIDKTRIYVTGYSMGGAGSFDIVAENPDTFAASAPLCGSGSPGDAAEMITTPMWVFHGSADPNIPVAQSRKMVAAIKKAGGTPRYTEYAGMGHNIWETTYTNKSFWDWMFSQKRAPSSLLSPKGILDRIVEKVKSWL